MRIVNTAQFETWNGADGHHWARHHERYDAMASGFTGDLLRAAALGEGDRILDVGCGTGQTTRMAARATHRGHAVGIDLSAPMLDRARQLTSAEGPDNVTFELGDAQVHPFPEASFDVAISRAGVMFFTDPVAAFTNIGASVKPGGRLVFICHREPSERVKAIFAALAQHLPTPDPSEEAEGVADFADPGHVHAVLTSAGFTGVTTVGVEVPSVLGGDAGEATDFLLQGQLRPFVEGADDTARRRAREAVQNSLRSCEEDGAVRIPARGWLVTATRP